MRTHQGLFCGKGGPKPTSIVKSRNCGRRSLSRHSTRLRILQVNELSDGGFGHLSPSLCQCQPLHARSYRNCPIGVSLVQKNSGDGNMTPPKRAVRIACDWTTRKQASFVVYSGCNSCWTASLASWLILPLIRRIESAKYASIKQAFFNKISPLRTSDILAACARRARNFALAKKLNRRAATGPAIHAIRSIDLLLLAPGCVIRPLTIG